ncbi:translation initiation factor IF-2 subunit beta [Desulfurococcus mucosus]|uniref:Translation initiation factor 2 subunit beta n=1 Tax=Desulfurococcus mucosus (strain ATCC 35584 / DSM 2162 / JCM 9187 / O7/1) TaxID=765177 RepID=E8RA94_DESM0|nr:translation initiation factor IF-2 subunit beta [Desulfurococcus mucosus]ADV65400.1 translation initiation factor 2 subunit beta (aeIF-2b) [Desulfurococcus mucosus DSM 2162]
MSRQGLPGYEKLLERAFEKLAGRRGSGEVFEMPQASVLVIGGKTIIQNFRQIANILNRDEELLKRYFMKELNVPSSINEAGQLELKGKFNPSAVNQLLVRFVERYVKCSTCGSVHTRLTKKGKVFVLRCDACGAETTLPAF